MCKSIGVLKLIVDGSRNNKLLLLTENFSDIVTEKSSAARKPPSLALELVELSCRLLECCNLLQESDGVYQLEVVCDTFGMLSSLLQLEENSVGVGSGDVLSRTKTELVRYILSRNMIENLGKLLMVADGSSIPTSTYYLFLEKSTRFVCNIFSPLRRCVLSPLTNSIFRAVWKI